MADYISREAALGAIKTAELGQEYEVAEAIPAADVVEVVRCRECKHYREVPSQTRDNAVVVWCAADKYPRNDVMPDGWYCAAGERKDGADNGV